MKKPVDADQVGQALAVGDLQGLVGAVAEPADLDALLGGEDRGAEGADDVVVGGGALAGASVRSEAKQHPCFREFAQAVLGTVLRVVERRSELVGGEDAVLVEQAEDGAVAVGEPASERGELFGDAAPLRRSTSAFTRT